MNLFNPWNWWSPWLKLWMSPQRKPEAVPQVAVIVIVVKP